MCSILEFIHAYYQSHIDAPDMHPHFKSIKHASLSRVLELSGYGLVVAR